MTQTFLLGDICDIKIGRTPPRNEDQWFSSTHGNKWVSIKDMGSAQKNIYHTSEYITNEAVAKFRIPKISKGTLLLSFKLTIGRLCFTTEDMYSNEAIAQLAVTNPPVVDKDWLYYYLKNFNYNSLSSTSSIATAVNSQTIKNVRITLPDLETQKKIADILGTIDEKIELNQRMNETLEQMGRALFRRYFIDNPEAEKWKNGQLGDLFEITMGQSPPGSSYNETNEGITFYQGRAEFGLRFPNKRLSTIDPKRLAKKGDVLLSVRAPVGDINQATEDCCIGRGLACIASKEKRVSFCYYMCRSLQDKLAEFDSEGTVFGAINGKQLKSIKITLPPFETIEQFERKVSSFDKQIFNNSNQIQTLTALRDNLLPQLISGKMGI